MQFLDSLLHKARAHRQTIVLAEGEDPRILTAASRARDDGIANCVLVGDPSAIERQAGDLGIDLTDIKIEDPRTSQYPQS